MVRPYSHGFPVLFSGVALDVGVLLRHMKTSEHDLENDPDNQNQDKASNDSNDYVC